jgi:glycopeptide antibiotics resistance protein
LPGRIWLDAEWALLPLPIIIPAIVWRERRRGADFRTITVCIAMATYVAALIALAFFPLPLPPYDLPAEGFADFRGWPYPWISPIPFETIRSSVGLGLEWPAARYLLGNLVAFAPLGVLVPLLRPSWASWRDVLLIGLAASVVIELAQLAMSLLMGFPFRVADVDDVILNTLGTILGFASPRMAQRFLRAIRA